MVPTKGLEPLFSKQKMFSTFFKYIIEFINFVREKNGENYLQYLEDHLRNFYFYFYAFDQTKEMRDIYNEFNDYLYPNYVSEVLIDVNLIDPIIKKVFDENDKELKKLTKKKITNI